MNVAALREKITFLENVLKEKDKIIHKKDTLISELTEQVALFKLLHFGPKSEKWTQTDDRQALLFNESEDEAFTQVDETGEKSEVEKTEVASHTRRKHRNQGRKPISPDLPREIIERDLSEEEKICECGSEMKCIGEDTSERVKIIPAKITVIREIKKEIRMLHL